MAILFFCFKMNPNNLFQKVWDAHTVKVLSNGQTQLFVGRHLIHEVTSPQAFGMLREKGLAVRATRSVPLPRLIISYQPMNQPNPTLILLQMR